MRAAAREVVGKRLPHARLVRVGISCTTPADVGETTVCAGSFAVRATAVAPRTYYVFTTRSRVKRLDAGTLTATLDATPYRPRTTARRRLPSRLSATYIL